MTTATARPPTTADLMPMLKRLRENTAAFERSIRPEFDAQPSLIPCPVHADQVLAADWEASAWESRKYAEFRLVRSKCPACVQAENVAEQHRFWLKRGVPARLLDATFATFRIDGDAVDAKQRALGKAREFAAHAGSAINPLVNTALKHGGFLLLIGTTGTGKGHLAVSVMKTLGEGGLFTTHPDLMTDLRASYNAGDTAQFLEKLKGAPCLILDEFGVSAGGKDEGPMLYQILADRHDKRWPTIITSNEELPTLKLGLGDRLLDRIREDYSVISCKWKSHRYES